MFEEERSVSVLAAKINELIEKYKEVVAENETLRQEVVKAKALNEAQRVQIAKLEQDVIYKDVNADDLLSKIEAVLNK
jgi:regulator of replication initiation timing